MPALWEPCGRASVVCLLAYYIPEVRVKWIYCCPGEVEMKFSHFSFGSIQIDGAMYEQDVLIDRGEILKRGWN